MDAIRQHAGVGRATFYRNFDDLQALSAAIFEQNVLALEQAIAADASFEQVMLATVNEGLECRALLPALATQGGTPEIAALSGRVAKLLGRALRTAQARGEVRSDLKAEDTLSMLAMVFATVLVAPHAKNQHARVKRALGFLLDGVRPR